MNVEIKKSSIHKTGVFAKRAFRVGDIVLKWDTSKRILNDDVILLSERSGNVHFHPLDEKTSFLVQSPECFVNHCCNNNTEVVDFADVAIKDIAIGEEITSNYETDGAGLSFICNCGDKDCRKHIGSVADIQNT